MLVLQRFCDLDNEMGELSEDELPVPGRWALIRDAALLQVKLVIDGFRDVLLVPASFIALIASLLSGSGGKPGPQFYQLLAMGRRSEQWIDLFGALKHSGHAAPQPDTDNAVSIDQVVTRMESYVIDEYARGGLTRQAKEQIDKALNALRKKNRKAT